MKKYSIPEVEILFVSCMDLLTTSGGPIIEDPNEIYGVNLLDP